MSIDFEKLERAQIEALDNILGKPFKVLDDGFVRVIDYMGSDESIVQAARVSYGKGTKKIHQDRGLIRYLMRHRHTTPFEMCEIKLHVRVPMDCWRQWIRHRTANINEYSTRYSIAIDATQTTAPEAWRFQAETNRQGSEGFLDLESGKEFSMRERELQDKCRGEYEARLKAGIATLDIYRSLLEGRSPQSASLFRITHGYSCSIRNPVVCRNNRERNSCKMVPHRMGGFHGLPNDFCLLFGIGIANFNGDKFRRC
jgi:flavin-dependent thymidylate synthase